MVFVQLAIPTARIVGDRDVNCQNANLEFFKLESFLDFRFSLRYLRFNFRCLIAERKAKKDKAPMTDRLMAKALALQVD